MVQTIICTVIFMIYVMGVIVSWRDVCTVIFMICVMLLIITRR